MQTARISSGPVFLPVDRHGRLDPGHRGHLSPVAVNRLVKTYAARIGLDPDLVFKENAAAQVGL
ncbi:MAG TPA: hypothetical protein VK988_15230 [Acidimicrobiales bacterium]|nr:hypothetical protein [Acidimicrobiales bacterium]